MAQHTFLVVALCLVGLQASDDEYGLRDPMETDSPQVGMGGQIVALTRSSTSPRSDRCSTSMRAGDAVQLFTITRKMHPVHLQPTGGYSIAYRSGDPGLMIEGVETTADSPATIAGMTEQQNGQLIVHVNGEDVHDDDYAFPDDYMTGELDRNPETVRGPQKAADNALKRSKHPENVYKPFTIGVRDVSQAERQMWKERHQRAVEAAKRSKIDAVGFEAWAAQTLDEMSTPIPDTPQMQMMRQIGMIPAWATTMMHIPHAIKMFLDTIPSGYLAGLASSQEEFDSFSKNQNSLGRLFRERGWQGDLPFHTSMQMTVEITGTSAEGLEQASGEIGQLMADETGGRVTTRMDRREGGLTIFETQTHEPRRAADRQMIRSRDASGYL